MKATFFKSNFECTPKVVDYSTIFNVIKSDYMADKVKHLHSLEKFHRSKFKSTFPAFCFYGDFENGRKSDDLVKANGVMLFDYDEVKNINEANRVKQVCEQLLGNQLLIMFTSPSYGVKFAVKTDFKSHDNEEYRFYYQTLLKEYEQLLDIKLDSQTCNLSRLCNLSYDPDVFFNDDSLIYSFSNEVHQQWHDKRKKDEAERIKSLKAYETTSINEHRKELATQRCIKNFKQKHDYNGQRHHGIFVLGMSLFQSGCNPHEIATLFRQLGSSYTETQTHIKCAQDIEKTWIKNGRKINDFVVKKHNPLEGFL